MRLNSQNSVMSKRKGQINEDFFKLGNIEIDDDCEENVSESCAEIQPANCLKINAKFEESKPNVESYLRLKAHTPNSNKNLSIFTENFSKRGEYDSASHLDNNELNEYTSKFRVLHKTTQK